MEIMTNQSSRKSSLTLSYSGLTALVVVFFFGFKAQGMDAQATHLFENALAQSQAESSQLLQLNSQRVHAIAMLEDTVTPGEQSLPEGGPEAPQENPMRVSKVDQKHPSGLDFQR